MGIRERIGGRVERYFTRLGDFATAEATIADARGVKADGYMSRRDVAYVVRESRATQGEIVSDDMVAKAIFDALDTDRDAYISEAEWKAGKR